MIGENAKRVDAFEKATGRTRYITDMLSEFPGLLHIKILRSPHAHARILKLDTGKAEKLEGVVKIITGNEPDVNWQAFPPQSRLAREEAIWAGQGVAIVAAESEGIAFAALDAIEVEYEPLPHALTWQDAFASSPKSIVDKEPVFKPSGKIPECDSPNLAGEYHLRHGDSAKAFEQADFVVEGEYWTGKKTHNQLERAASVSRWEPDGSITTWCNGCGVHGVIKKALCNTFDMPAAKVRVISPCSGGSFGNRNVPYAEVISFLVALKTRRTAGIVYSREEMFTAAPSNWICATKVRLGADKNGNLVAKDIRLIEEIGASTGNVAHSGRLSCSSTANTYAVPNVKMDTYALLTNTVPSGPYRGLGTPDAVFGQELLLNELAERVGISPLQIRLKNLIQRGQEDDFGEKITSIGLDQCLRGVAKAIDLEEPGRQDDSVWRYGKGIACCGKQNGPNGRSEAEVLVHHDGSVQLLLSCDNHGMGLTTALTQIAAEELGLPVSGIDILIADTAVTPYDNFSASSSGVYRTGQAIRLACQDVLAQLREAAARHVGIPTSLVTVRGNVAYFVGCAVESMPITQLFAPLDAFRQDVWGLKQGTPVRGAGLYSAAQATPMDENGRTPRMWNWFQYAATAVEIAVNTETGQIRVERIATAADTGNPINPKIIETQIEGSAHMALGFCLQEEHIYNDNGKIANASFGDYRLPLSTDLPHNSQVFSLICPDPLPDGPYGAKGMSESVVSAVGAAIAGALYQAVGIRVHSYPMTAERILRLINEKEDRS